MDTKRKDRLLAASEPVPVIITLRKMGAVHKHWSSFDRLQELI
jgi:hypothetical protein